MIRFFVKGNQLDLLNAAYKHGINDVVNVRGPSQFNQSWAETDPKNLHKIVDWYCEPRNANEDKSPFDPGTLLYYT